MEKELSNFYEILRKWYKSYFIGEGKGHILLVGGEGLKLGIGPSRPFGEGSIKKRAVSTETGGSFRREQ